MPEDHSAAVEQRMKRWQEQRWLLDAVVRTVGIDWDQGRTQYYAAPCGPDAAADMAQVRNRVRKFADISREFTRAARRREGVADAAERDGHAVTARENYFIASILWGAAQWPIFENSAENLEYDARKVHCYGRFIAHAPHPVRRVEIPSRLGSIPAYLHMPSGSNHEPVPCVVCIPGMDTFKEMTASMYGDKLLERGVARLCIDGPGQGECLTRGIWVSATNHVDACQAAFEWLRQQPEIDGERLGIHGISMGSFWGTHAAAGVDGVKACAVELVCHEPGMHTIFNMASPTFKLRFMYMAGHQDEAAFDAYAQTFTLDGVAERIQCPYLIVAGEDDELSPIEHTYRLFDQVRAPKELVVYQGELHSIGAGPAAQLGPSRATLIADWLADRMADKPLHSRRVYVETSGVIRTEALS
jgi:dienelactone hydrolase